VRGKGKIRERESTKKGGGLLWRESGRKRCGVNCEIFVWKRALERYGSF